MSVSHIQREHRLGPRNREVVILDHVGNVPVKRVKRKNAKLKLRKIKWGTPDPLLAQGLIERSKLLSWRRYYRGYVVRGAWCVLASMIGLAVYAGYVR